MNDIFVREDIAKPENRINLAIFHLQMIEEFHRWFCTKLGLPKEAVIYPTENLAGDRPDFIIKNGQHTLGYIEVELGGENKTQLLNYRNKYEKNSRRVFSITGLKTPTSDLGLDELKTFLLTQYDNTNNSQTKMSIDYLFKLIDTYTNNVSSYSRNPVSKEVLERPFVNNLLTALCNYKPDTNQKRAEPGKYYCDTNSPKGFSFRVYSPYAAQKSLSLLSITKGSEYITFLSAEKYRHYLAHKSINDVESWIAFITKKLSLPVDKKEFDGRANISLSIVSNYFDDLITHIKKLI